MQVNKKRKFAADGVFFSELNELLTSELAEEGYSGVEVRVTGVAIETTYLDLDDTAILITTNDRSLEQLLVAIARCAPPTRAPPASANCRSGFCPGCREEEGQWCSWRSEQSMARAAYSSEVSVVLLLSASAIDLAPASPIWFPLSLQRGGRGSVVLVAVGTKHGACDLLERSERRVALERVRDRLGARIADLVAAQAGARRKRVSGARGDRHRARRARLT